jgi:cytochrome c peroxidase
MRMNRLFAVALIGLASFVSGVAGLFQTSAHAQAVGGPLPPVPTPPNLIQLAPIEQLGKDMLYDNTLSNPSGYACAQCHAKTTGFASGLDSIVNERGGPQPGIIPGRFGPRKPQSYAYSAFSPEGPFFDTAAGIWIGGTFWDGRTVDNSGQAHQPPINPNEMNNTPTNGVFPPTFGGFSALLVQKLQSRPYTPLIKRIFGQDVFTKFTTSQIYDIFCEAIAAFEASGEICSFSSKFDASQFGTPPQNLYTLTASEERGRILYGVGPNPNNDPTFGQAQCFQCHSSAAQPGIQLETEGKETFTMYCFANIGIPKNPGNPFYQNTDATANPNGFNALGTDFIDFGLGANPNPAPDAAKTRFFTTTPGDNIQFNGLFQTPTNRNVDVRPTPTFVKAYMHNGILKSLQEVVHFYNARNIAVDVNGNQVAFDLRNGPPAGFTAMFPPPEVLDNVQNVAGLTAAQAAAAGTAGVTAQNGQVGNLGLSASQEADLVNFLKILSDGFTAPNPVGP